MSASKMVAPAAGEPAEPPGAIGVGIDFGTTYSSVVFIHSDKKRVVSVQYPNQLHYVERGQAPSVVTAYDLRTAPNIENPPSSQSQHPNWGFSAPATHQIFELFKLSLMPQQHLSDRFWRSPSVAKARNTLRARRVTAEEATEVFLRELWDFSLGEAAREFGMSVGQMRAAPLLVAMGIPANWSRDTVTALREAANNAGISGSHAHPAISFLPETEADLISFIADKAISTDFEVSPLFSAHSPLHTLKTYGPVSDNPQDGDIIGICDVGGGTIVSLLIAPGGWVPTNTQLQDTGTYMYMHEASTTAATPMFQECVAGDSQLAGTILLDDTFFTQVETKLRYQTTEKVRSLITRESIVQHFSEPWHSNLKRQFNGTGGFSILVPGFFMTWNQRKERRGPNYNPPRVSFTQ
ncbi:hypothetical protein F5144DRAFT_395151 [Chaetomium tenue]|uniref:Uncharacterized protein n=1 Tax=Chaetomium tenue TaxID=1854479 RepID=A0ACB7NWC6_9PEZI|nr:hypothetical protein F5144DRAFT_395151 [Chaetomium globosum]